MKYRHIFYSLLLFYSLSCLLFITAFLFLKTIDNGLPSIYVFGEMLVFPLSFITSNEFIGVGLKYIIPVILFGCLLVTFNERKTRGWYKFYIPVLIYLGYFALHTWVIVSQLHPSASTYFMYARIFRVYMTHMLWHLCLMAGLLPFWIRDWN